MERIIEKHGPDIVVAEGDTTTVLVTALTSFYLGIPFGHLEAGLRTGDLRAPFPEELIVWWLIGPRIGISAQQSVLLRLCTLGAIPHAYF